ncbi:MAG: TnpV protein [Ruminococcaceae bacterium]|nr:TnpV protein [Oscillospiraceae bacterium]
MNATMKNNTNIQYRQVGGYNIPNLILPPEEANIILGKWGVMHKDYLMKNKKVLFTTLLTQGKLYQHCAEVEKQAQQVFDTLIEQMKAAEGVTEELKEHDQWEWVQRMSNIEQRAREIVCKELIFN